MMLNIAALARPCQAGNRCRARIRRGKVRQTLSLEKARFTAGCEGK
jgi:hypothetical protein